ncbi:MAG TPA: alpha/beta fold hydrolase [Candidatus Kapabacteria bacterium]|nr:alpha/beta fold hydrolase [Candidatus Kapabacteria bacterium]
MTTQKLQGAAPAGNVDGEMLSVISGDGVLNRLTLYRAAQDRAVLLCMPAMGVRASFYRPLAVQLALAGWHVVTADLRGVGESGVRVKQGARFGYREMLEQDWPANLAVVREHFPGLPVYLLGHSLGGQLNALFAAQNPGAVAGLIFSACGSVYFRGWSFPASLKILGQSQLIRGITEIVGYLPGDKVGFGGIEAKGLVRDWANVALTGRYRPAGSEFDYEAALEKLQLPVLALSYTDDAFAPVSATRWLLAKMPRAQATHLTLSPSDLGASVIGHIGWVKNNGRVVQQIADWLAPLTGVQ